MYSHDTDELFPEDGWRDPGDDASRLAYYMVCALGFVLGLAGSIYMGLLAFDPVRVEVDMERPPKSYDLYLFGGLSLFSAAVAGAALLILVREAKHWSLKKLTADKVVAGIFLLAVATGIIAFWMLQAGGAGSLLASSALLVAALGIFILALILGLGVAGYQALSNRPRRLGQARIVARYGVDDKLQRIDAHPCPSEDGLTAVVEVEFLGGELTTFRATPSAYDLARPGKVGTILGTRRRLTGFKPER